MGNKTESARFIMFDISNMDKKYEIWCGTSLSTGDEGRPTTPTLMGRAYGKDFKDACKNHFSKTNDSNWNPSQNTYWACSLYDNAEEAWKQYNEWGGTETIMDIVIRDIKNKWGKHANFLWEERNK